MALRVLKVKQQQNKATNPTLFPVHKNVLSVLSLNYFDKYFLNIYLGIKQCLCFSDTAMSKFPEGTCFLVCMRCELVLPSLVSV